MCEMFRPHGHRALAHTGLTSSMTGGVRIGSNAEELEIEIVEREEKMNKTTLRSHSRTANVTLLSTPVAPYTHLPLTTTTLTTSRTYRHPLGRLWEARLLSPALTSTFVGRVFAPRQATTFISRTRLSMRNVGGTYIPRIGSRLCFPDLQMRPSHAGHQIMAEARLYRPQVALSTLCVPFRK